MPRSNQNNRGGNRRSNNNNPEGRNQYSSGWTDMARDRPVAAAAAAAGAVAAGVFLWSKRSQISDQLSQISDQIGEWTENLSSQRELEMAGGDTAFRGSTGSPASEEFGDPPSAIGSSSTRATADRSARPTIGRRGSSSGSGTMSGGSLDTGPSGRGRE